MAYAALISVAKTIDQILNHDPISLPGTQKITSIHEHAILLQKFLEEFQEKAIGFEGQIREVANKAEDVIEYFVLERNSGSINSTGPSKVAKFKRQLRKLAEKMKSIVGEVIEIKNSVKQQLNKSPAASSMPRSFLEYRLFFPHEDLILIKDQLCGEPSQLQILPIVGRRGIGKTTLAEFVYSDRLIEGHFNIRAWVRVSRDDNAREILSELLHSMRGQSTYQSIELMVEDVYRNLKGK